MGTDDACLSPFSRYCSKLRRKSQGSEKVGHVVAQPRLANRVRMFAPENDDVSSHRGTLRHEARMADPSDIDLFLEAGTLPYDSGISLVSNAETSLVLGRCPCSDPNPQRPDE